MSKRNFIPVNEQDRDICLKIMRSVCSSDFMDKFRYNLIPETFEIYTVVLAFMDGIHSIFANPEVEILSIGDLLIVEKTVRNNARAEKSGNINCKMYLGEVGKAVFEDGIDGYEDVIAEDTELRKLMLGAASLAVKKLTDYAISGLKPEDVYHIANAFFTYMILTVAECAKNENVADNEFRFEVGSHLSYFIVRFKRGVRGTVMTLNVGPALKLTVKSDMQTE